MSNKIGRHLYKHGLFAGWTEYRRGEARAERYEAIFSDARREQLSARVVELLEEWRSSPFENEGLVRHQLRHSLCLAGYGWGRSDAEAATVVGMAFTTLGVARPQEDEGQRDAPNEEFYCSWCSCAIDDERRTRLQRFCSVECAKIATVYRERRESEYQGVVMRSAARMIARSKAPPRVCLHCAQTFQTDRETALYCSPKCTSHGTLGDRLVPDIVCEACGEITRPKNRGSRFCSLECSQPAIAAERRERLAEVVRQCEECQKDFTPASSGTRYCSGRCGSRARNRDYKARGGTPAAFTYTCRCCGVGFVSRKPKAPYCGKPCKDIVDRYESGQAKRLSSRIFDYMLHRDHVPMTGLAITDRLFESA